ncbi:hypothetical protein [Clostridiisalibacter paucivorans]|uniref:hypothetical protein n=1 Tax=Clostridiisalibacter paucivorans TaxID=408753 RepID=UPI00047D2C4C|nr:hypothetical protein [Clostridiisalibacter paucivorans]
MGKWRVSEVIAYFNSDIKSIWDVVTNNEDYKWRSDIERVEIINKGESFIEYNHKGQAVKFTITNKKKYEKYEFRMENKFFYGFWTGTFFSLETGGTKIIFTEKIYIRNPIMKIMSYLFLNLKKMQQNYIVDLKNKLGD